MDSLDEKTFTTSRKLVYRYYASKPSTFDPSKPTLLLGHGWPDSAQLWRFIIPHLQKLSYRLVIPDCLGYGGTSKPTDPSLYAGGAMANDLIEILDSEDIDKVIPIGHDWGSMLAQRVYLFHPSRVLGLVMLSVYYNPPVRSTSLDVKAINQTLEQYFGAPLYAYWELFTTPEGVQLFDQNVERAYYAQHGDDPAWMKKLFCTYGGMRDFMISGQPAVDLKPYAANPAIKDPWISKMKAQGFEAPFCWYKAYTEGHHASLEKNLPENVGSVDVPALWIGGDQDAVCFERKSYQSSEIKDLTAHEMRDVGHWIPYERPDEVAGFIVEWLKEKGF